MSHTDSDFCIFYQIAIEVLSGGLRRLSKCHTGPGGLKVEPNPSKDFLARSLLRNSVGYGESQQITEIFLRTIYIEGAKKFNNPGSNSSPGPHSPNAETVEFAHKFSEVCKQRLCGFAWRANHVATFKSFKIVYAFMYALII